MFIYCSGDSFTRGVELADHVLPGWPGLHSANDTKKLREGMQWFINQQPAERAKLSSEELAQYYSLERELAWPNHLGKLLGATVVNSGVGGSSQGDTNYRIMIDIERLVAQGQKIDCVIIQMTSGDRIEMYDRIIHRHDTDYFTSSRLAGWGDHYPYNDKKFVQYWDLLEPDVGKHLRALTQLVFIRNYIKSKLGIEPIFVDSVFKLNYENCFWPLISNDNNANKELRVLLEATNIFNFETLKFKIIDMMHLMDLDQLHLAPGGHYCHELHLQFAELVVSTHF